MRNDPAPSPDRPGLGGQVGDTEGGRTRTQGAGGLVDRLRQHCEARMEDLRTVAGSGFAAGAQASSDSIDKLAGNPPDLDA